MKEALLEPVLRAMRLSRVIKHINPGTKLLDIGCGVNANFLKSLSGKLDQGYGLDFKVDTQTPENIHLQQSYLTDKLPFEDNFFDYVTMLAVLEHIEYDVDILKEIKRVLKPNAKLILTVPSVWSQPVLEFLAFKIKIVSATEIADHKRYYNFENLHKSIIEDSGFTSMSHRYFQLRMNNFCIAIK
ncbi:class I SAM-dependent methyltransferase [Prochlorothrix hollandica]|uniref:Methyltransferase type 11 n=1 Tax=Prochlorothrix hollandica PCC 9006 = CALU 1027 TaxID=317619 RepID=A0A0M2PSC9_PROHO|nr:class I SAM-dependent methyltransferase [Prochlorothrix hollandica]KKI99029.1 methyltransferase type 11 [Prochlorothrix hollandica PCC 9006 = CALU 1027]